MGEYHGDEPEIEYEYRMRLQAYEDEHADDYKYTEEWLSEPRGIYANNGI